jgi:hypothetical protein
MLYFRYVIPLGVGLDVLVDSLRAKWRGESTEVFRAEKLSETVKQELLPPNLRHSEFFKRLNAVNQASIPFVMEMSNSALGKDSEFDFDPKQHFANAVSSFFSYYPQLRPLPLIIDSEFTREIADEGQDIAVTIPSLRLINASATSWEQITDFRKDKEAMERLRRFRVFAYQNYTGQSRNFIEDDILTRIYEYELAIKKCGFATTSAAITTILDSNLIAGGIAGSFISAYLQSPLATVLSVAGTAGITIGKIAIELRKQSFAKQEIMMSHPVSYVSYAREKLEAE